MDLNEKYRVMTLLHVGDGCSPTSKARTDIYLLDPGQCFDRFGGSRHGLVVRKTGSLVVSHTDSFGQQDTEHALNSERALQFWAHVARRIAAGDTVVPPGVAVEPDADATSG